MSIRDKYINLVEKLDINPNVYRNNLCDVPIYFINLERSKSRKQFILDQIEKYNIKNTHFIKAIDGNYILKLKNNFYSVSNDFCFYSGSNNTSMTEYGCLLSHIKAIMKAYEDGHEHVLICEDDVDLYWIKIWNTTIDDIIKNAPKNWEYISISSRKHNNISHQKKQHIVDWFKLKPNYKEILENEKEYYESYIANNYVLAAGQIINRKGMKKIIDTFYQDNMYIFRKKYAFVNNKIVADHTIQYLLNSYSYRYRLIVVYNDYIKMKSTISSIHTDKQILHSNKAIETLYENYIN